MGLGPLRTPLHSRPSPRCVDSGRPWQPCRGPDVAPVHPFVPGPEWTEEIPDQPEEPLGPHPRAAHQQGGQLIQARGVPRAPARRPHAAPRPDPDPHAATEAPRGHAEPARAARL